jgi:hypothetical protein
MRHAYGNAHIQSNGDSNVYAHSDCDGNSHIRSDGDSNSNVYAYSDSNCHSNSNGYSNSYCEQTAAAFTDATAPADTAAACEQLL